MGEGAKRRRGGEVTSEGYRRRSSSPWLGCRRDARSSGGPSSTRRSLSARFSPCRRCATDSYRGVLAIRDVRALIAASAASQLGDWLYNAALLGYVYSATGSPGWVGAATIFRLLPYALLGPVGGAVADRYDRRTVLLVGDLLRCVQMFALAAVVAFDGPVVLVIVLTALASAAGTAERPAAMALLPRLVGEARLGPANALLHTVQDLGLVAGPALGAVLLAVTTADRGLRGERAHVRDLGTADLDDAAPHHAGRRAGGRRRG